MLGRAAAIAIVAMALLVVCYVAWAASSMAQVKDTADLSLSPNPVRTSNAHASLGFRSFTELYRQKSYRTRKSFVTHHRRPEPKPKHKRTPVEVSSSPAPVESASSSPSVSPSPSPSPSYTPSATATPTYSSSGGNPFRDVSDLQVERTDMGKDFGGTGPIFAVADGTIEQVYQSGWPEGIFIMEKLDEAVNGNDYVYYAEDITPDVSVGESVTTGTEIGSMYDGGDGIECGWASGGPGETLAAALGEYNYDGEATAAGTSFWEYLQTLGVLHPDDHPATPL